MSDDCVSIDVLRRHKKELEEKILKLLREFEDKYAVVVDSVDLQHIYNISGESELYNVEIKVSL